MAVCVALTRGVVQSLINEENVVSSLLTRVRRKSLRYLSRRLSMCIDILDTMLSNPPPSTSSSTCHKTIEAQCLDFVRYFDRLCEHDELIDIFFEDTP